MPVTDMSMPMSEEEMSAMEEVPMEEEAVADAELGGDIAEMTMSDVAARLAEGSMTMDEVMAFLQPEAAVPAEEELAMGGPEELM